MTQPQPGRQIEVLLVEDDPGDVLMTKEAFEDYKLSNQLHVVNDGAEAMDFLVARASTLARRGQTSCCSTSTCRAWTGGRCFRRSSPTLSWRASRS